MRLLRIVAVAAALLLGACGEGGGPAAHDHSSHDHSGDCYTGPVEGAPWEHVRTITTLNQGDYIEWCVDPG